MLINVNDLLKLTAIFIGVCLLIAIGILLLIALIHIIRTAKKVNIILDVNAENVAKTVKKLPDLADNMHQASVSVKVNADKIGTAVDSIENTFSDTSSGDKTDVIMSIANIAEDVVKMIISIFSKKS